MLRSPLALVLIISASSAACTPGTNTPPPLPPAEPSAESDATADDVYGRYRHVGGAADAAARDAAIDRAVEPFPSFVRGRARSRLTKVNAIPPEFTISKTDAGVKVSGERDILPAAPLGGAPVAFTAPDGETTLRVSYVTRGVQLVQTVRGPRGGTRRIFTPKAGGAQLDVRVMVFSERFEKPLQYHLDYARKPDPASSSAP